MSWWWEFFHEQNMEPYFRSVREVSDMMLKAGNGSFEQLPVSADLLHAQAIKCGNTYFIYLLNESDDAMTTPVSLTVGGGKNFTVQSLEPASLKYTKVSNFTLKDNKLTFNHIFLNGKQETVLILTTNAKPTK
jgi:hypothetical protein